MAQLRQDYQRFEAANTEILVIVPNGTRMIARYVHEHEPRYRILSDKGAEVARQYGVRTRNILSVVAFKPTVILVGKSGKILYTNYTSSFIAEPDNREPLAVLARPAIER
jgi:peroxiredoxin